MEGDGIIPRSWRFIVIACNGKCQHMFLLLVSRYVLTKHQNLSFNISAGNTTSLLTTPRFL